MNQEIMVSPLNCAMGISWEKLFANIFVAQVKMIEKNSMKIKLDVSVRAPQILIPQDSQHKEGFIIDLGHFVVSNSFQIIPETAEMEKKAIVDMISVEMTHVAIVR